MDDTLLSVSDSELTDDDEDDELVAPEQASAAS